MTARRFPISDLPYWPRCLSREEAARYVGVSPNVFDSEVTDGKWPSGERRGAKGGRLTWDRRALEMRLDARLGSVEDIVTDDFEDRRRAAEAQRRQQGRQARA